MATTFKNVDDYISAQPEAAIPHLEAIRAIIKEAAPDTEEYISYGMPAYKQHKAVVYFGAGKVHLGFYPTPSPIEVFAEELSSYKTSKGAIQFPYDKKLPKALIKKIVQYRLKEDAEQAKKKKK